MTLMVFFVAFSVCQIIYGPVSDMVGRKPPLYFGIAVFALGSIGCSLAPSINWLIFFRFVQGLGAAAVMVIPRAVIRDLHTGVDATRLMSLVMLGLQRIANPGAAHRQRTASCRSAGAAVFVRCHDCGRCLSFALVAFVLPETRPPEERVQVSVRSVLDGFGELLRDWRFLGLTFIGGFRHGELLRVPRELVVHLYRPFRPDADAVQSGVFCQRDRFYRRLASSVHISRSRFGIARGDLHRGHLLRRDVGLQCSP